MSDPMSLLWWRPEPFAFIQRFGRRMFLQRQASRPVRLRYVRGCHHGPVEAQGVAREYRVERRTRDGGAPMSENMNDLRCYLTGEEREEAAGLSFGAGEFTQNDIRLAELEQIAIERKATHLGSPLVCATGRTS